MYTATSFTFGKQVVDVEQQVILEEQKLTQVFLSSTARHIQDPIGFVWLLIGLKSGTIFLSESNH